MLYSTKISLVLCYILNNLDKEKDKIVLDNAINYFLNEIIKNISNKKIHWNIPNEFSNKQDINSKNIEIKNWNYYKIISFISKNSFLINMNNFLNKNLYNAFENTYNVYLNSNLYPSFNKDSLKVIRTISNFDLKNVKGFKIINFDRTIADPMRFFDIFEIIYKLSKDVGELDKDNKKILINNDIALKIKDELSKEGLFKFKVDEKVTPINRIKSLIKPIRQFKDFKNNDSKKNKNEVVYTLSKKDIDVSIDEHLSTSPYESFLIDFLKLNSDNKIQLNRKNNLYLLVNVLSLFWELKTLEQNKINELYNNELVLFCLSLKANLDYKEIIPNIIKYHKNIINKEEFKEKFDFFINEFLIKRQIKLSSWKSIRSDMNQFKNNYLKYTRLFDIDKNKVSFSKLFSSRIEFMMTNFNNNYFLDENRIVNWIDTFATLKGFIKYIYEYKKYNLIKLYSDNLKILSGKIDEIKKELNFSKFIEITIFKKEKEIIKKIKDIGQEEGNINTYNYSNWVDIFYLFDAIEYNIDYKYKKIKLIYSKYKKSISPNDFQKIKNDLESINDKIFIGYWLKPFYSFKNYEYYVSFIDKQKEINYKEGKNNYLLSIKLLFGICFLLRENMGISQTIS